MDPIFEHVRNLEKMMSQGASFSQMENYINSTNCSEEQKSVLWLITWAEPGHTESSKVTKRLKENLKSLW